MPHPNIKVSAMANIFQPQPLVENRYEDTDKDEKVRKGTLSISVFGESGFSEQKALLKRTNSQKDRFSSTRKMWESRGSSDRLYTSNSSITSPGSFIGTSKSENNVEGRFSSARKMWESRGSDCLNTSVNSNITFTGSFNATPKSGKSGESDAKETGVENKGDEPKSKIIFNYEQQNKQVNCMDNLESSKRNPFQIQKFYNTESSFPEAETLSGKSVSVFVAEDAELDVSVFDTEDAELGGQQSSPRPPPLPSLPPPTTPGMKVQGHCVPPKTSPDFMHTRLPATLAKIIGVDKALEDKVDRSSDAPLVMVVEEERLTSRSDSQDTLLEYAELCETFHSLDFDKVDEEFDRLSNFADSDSDHSEEVPGSITKIVEETPTSPRILPCKGSPGQTSNTTNFPMASNALDAIPSEPECEVLCKNIVDTETTEITSNLDEGCHVSESVKVMKNVDDMSRFETPTQSVNKSTNASDGVNTSSLGSSLVGQSVTSWLDTPGSVFAESSCVSVDPSPEAVCTSNKMENYDLDPSIGESSDYVSGNSVELGSSSSVTGLSPEPCLNGLDDKIHHLSDGNFWVEGSPLVPTSVLENTNPLYHNPTKVKFSTSPVRIYSTFTDAEYDRKNEDVDPAAASAEYELEKRVEKMDTFEIKLTKGEDGLGLSILGMGVGVDAGVEKLGIFIKTLTVGGTAAIDGRMKVNDQIISVDGSSLVGVTQEFAASVLRNTTGLVTFVIGRDRDPGESEVAKIIKQCVEADMDQDVERDEIIIETSTTKDTAEEESGNKPCSSIVEARQFDADNGGGMAWLDKFSKHLLRDDSTEMDGSCTPKKLSIDDKDTTIEWEERGKDPLQNYFNSSTSVIRENENLYFETSADCCPYRKIYPSLLVKYDEAQETIEQLRRNLSIVTEQLVTRDQLFTSHMARLREVFRHLEEQFECKDDNKSFWLSLEPRGALRRKPFIPDDLSSLASTCELSGSCLDQAIPRTPVLDNSLAREKVMLVHRGTFARRTKGKRNSNPPSFVEDGSNLPVVVNGGISSIDYDTMPTEKGSQDPGSAFQEELRKKILNGISVIKSTEISDKVVVPANKACSLPTSPAGSPNRSTSSIQSVPGREDSPTEFKREKKRLSGIKLWNKARRRLSSR